ncbi:MAG: geranylgeranylglycerol-phosphate geranylgeranyltransferase [Bacteroidetes bacterium]|nr:geranylgeranylglycerol-phosphate geranylgeranyltransferase [Bacteroidota bacterium]
MHSENTPSLPVTSAKFLRGLVALMRPVNAVVAFVGIAAACVIAGAGWSDLGRIATAAAAGMLLGSAGNIINDVYDQAIDRINKPRRAVAAGIVSPRAAVIWAVVCAVAGLTLSIPLGSTALLIAAGSAVLMYLYSASLKRVPLLGNITVGVLTGAAFIFGGVAFGNPAAGIVPALFAFFFNAAREILKDVEDMRGDGAHAVRTFPLIAGESAALTFVSVLLVLVMLGSALPFLLSFYSSLYFWVVFFGVDCVLAYVLFAMWNDRSTGNIARLNLLLKYDMLMGIAAIVLGTY